MAESKLRLSIALIFGIGLVALIEARGDRKHFESVYKNIFDDSANPKVVLSIDLVADGLLKWAQLDYGQRRKLLADPQVETLNQLSSLFNENLNCDQDHLTERLQFESRYNQNYVNLHPFIKFANLMLTNGCYQDYESKLMTLLDTHFDKIRWVAWVHASDDGDSEFSLDNFSARLARYLKHFHHEIERVNFNSDQEHLKRIESEVEKMMDAVCPRLTGLDLSASGPATQQVGELFSHSIGRFDTGYHSLMREVASTLNKQSEHPYASGMYTFKWICQDQHKEQLISRVQTYFINHLDARRIDERVLGYGDRFGPTDYIAMTQILFARYKLAKVRMGDQYTLLNCLYTGQLYHLLPGDLCIESATLEQLIELRHISLQKCSSKSLNERRDLESEFGSDYVVLYPYIKSLNILQYDLCNQRLRQSISDTLPPKTDQLSKLERLRDLVEKSTSQLDAGQASSQVAAPTCILHERVEVGAFAKGLADFLYLSSTCKVSNKSVVQMIDSFWAHNCRDMVENMSSATWLEMHDTLDKLGLIGTLNEATKRALSYARICNFIRSPEFEVERIITELDNSPARNPNYSGSGGGWLSCFRS